MHLRHFVGAVHFFDRGGKQQVCALAFDQRSVPRFIARVGREIFMRTKLSGVDEQGDDRPITRRECRLHQRQMPLMQRAHGGHQADAQAFGPPAAHVGAQVGRRSH